MKEHTLIMSVINVNNHYITDNDNSVLSFFPFLWNYYLILSKYIYEIYTFPHL